MAYSGLDVLSGEPIELSEAEAMTHAFQQQHPAEQKAYFIGAERLRQLIEQEGCIGVRIYNGYDAETRKKNMVLVAVNTLTNDMTDGVIIDRLIGCPAHCDATSSLILNP